MLNNKTIQKAMGLYNKVEKASLDPYPQYYNNQRIQDVLNKINTTLASIDGKVNHNLQNTESKVKEVNTLIFEIKKHNQIIGSGAVQELSEKVNELGLKLSQSNSKKINLEETYIKDFNGIVQDIYSIREKIKEIQISYLKTVIVAGDGIRVEKTENKEGIAYKIHSTVKPNLTVQGGGGGVKKFTQLEDGAGNYDGKATKLIAVKADETGLEYVDDKTGVTSYLYGSGGASVNVAGQTVEIFVPLTAGVTDTDSVIEGVSNFYLRGNRFIGTGGVSVAVDGLTITIYGNSQAIDTNQVSEGVSNFYYTSARFNSDLTTKTTNNLSEGTSNFYYTETKFDSSLTTKTTNDLNQGVSNFYYSNILFNGSLATKTTDNLTEGSSNFYYNPLTYKASGGVSISVTGKTITINVPLTAGVTDSDSVNEGVSNFYYKANRFIGTGGVSVSSTGITLTIYGLSTQVNADNVALGNSNFFYNPLNLNNTGGISLSISGMTITIYTNPVYTARTVSVVGGATITPEGSSCDQYNITGISQAFYMNTPNGTPYDAQRLLVRIRDGGATYGISWNAIYRAGTDIVLPVTVGASRTTYCGFIFNNNDTKWDFVALVEKL